MKILVIRKKYLGILLCFLLITILVLNTNRSFISVLSRNLKPIYSTKTETNQIAITFDISWGEKNVLPILEILSQENVKATFFLSSPWAEKHSDLVKLMVSNGHEIGSHGRRHVDLNTLSEQEIIKELTLANNSLEKTTQKKINLLRTPNGAYDNKVITTASQLGLKVIQWSVDSLDWKRPGVEAVINNVINGRKKNNGAKPGDIILFHASDSAPDTPKALPTIIQALNNKGYSLVPVGVLLENSYETWPPESNI